jgi:hypothetical protein
VRVITATDAGPSGGRAHRRAHHGDLPLLHALSAAERLRLHRLIAQLRE